MASAYEIAADLLRSFGENVVARRPPKTYGEYASAIGHNPAKHGLAVGKAMHAIGALCIIRKVPVAPLFWVRRADGGYRGIFEKDPLERQHIIESKDIDIMYVVSREYIYTTDEFIGLEKALRDSLDRRGISQWSPHELWHLTFEKCPKDSQITHYQSAMLHYREIFNQLKTKQAVRR